ncbi:MAG: aminopeptidase P family protein [Rhodospirillaceae bacterium]|nr:aminopeptidase P family protein [Rhodospirillaceae bacterium]
MTTQIFKDARKATFLNQEGADKPLKSPIADSVVEAARAYRMGRLRQKMAEHDCAAMLLYDPINIRYAFEVSNMQVWTAHNAVRYALLLADGPSVMFETTAGMPLWEGVDAVDELRVATPWLYMTAGGRADEFLNRWADEITDLVRTHGGGNKRIAIDKCEPPGAFALKERGLDIQDGLELTERARSIKSADEIALMRWTVRVCEAAMARIYENSVPGRTEQELWAEMSYENARSGGEWLETRLLACGANTNPWYHECDDTVCQLGEMISLDTDLIGPYGYCADLSRSWTCGYTPMTNSQRRMYGQALEQVTHNTALLRPGMSFAEYNEKSWRIPQASQAYPYGLALHGVGMADEWPCVYLHHINEESGYEGTFEEGMVVCVESLMAEEGTESIKLETQVLITADGPERLDSFPWEEV